MIRRLTASELQEIRDYAITNGQFLEWTTQRIPVGDPLILGSYATRRVLATCWKGDLVWYLPEGSL